MPLVPATPKSLSQLRDALSIVMSTGLSVRQVDLLLWFHDRPDHTPPFWRLAHDLGISKPTLCRTLDVLGSHGLVVRLVDDRDSRIVRVGLTTAGREMTDSIERSWLKALGAASRPPPASLPEASRSS
jgi:DNA-binding MarR family transcriptional regulator